MVIFAILGRFVTGKWTMQNRLGLNHQDRRVMNGGYGGLEHWIHVSTGTRLPKISPKCWLSNSFPTSSSCAIRWCLSLCPASAGRSFRATGESRVTSREFEKRWSTLGMDWRFGAQKKMRKKIRPLGLWGWDSSGSGWYATLRADRWENWEDFRVSQSISADRLGKCWISLKYVEKGQKNQKTPRSLHLNDNKLSVAKSSAKPLENCNLTSISIAPLLTSPGHSMTFSGWYIGVSQSLRYLVKKCSLCKGLWHSIWNYMKLIKSDKDATSEEKSK